jgi:magnesium-transporting ATPase (P-type)
MKRRGDLEEISWGQLEVGDIVRLKKGEMCPADIILLDSNDIHNKEAVCYVDTSLVDGRTSLQMKTACSVTQRKSRFKIALISIDDFVNLSISAITDPPQEQIPGISQNADWDHRIPRAFRLHDQLFGAYEAEEGPQKGRADHQ